MTTANILWFLAIGAIVYFMVKTGGGCCGGHHHDRHGGSGTGTEGPPTGNDPVCGMQVNDDSSTPTSKYEGRTFRFCSDHCKRVFDLDPGNYMRSVR